MALIKTLVPARVQSPHGLRILSRLDMRMSLDELYYKARLRSKSGKKRLFHGGWGDQKIIDVVDRLWDVDLPAVVPSIHWKSELRQSNGVLVKEGWFESATYHEWLPVESQMAGVRFVVPLDGGGNSAVLLAPTSREIGYARRMKTAIALAKKGVCCLLLDNPFMGTRKPAAQFDTIVSHYSDYPLLSATCVEENRQGLAWLHSQGFTRICAAGHSQGGFTTIAAALRMYFSVGVVAVVAPHSGEPVVTEGIPGRLCDWDEMQRTCPAGATARERMHKIFERTRLDFIPIRDHKPQIHLIAAKRDLYVPEYSYQLMLERWGDMASIEWTNGGHVSTILERGPYIKAIESILFERSRALTKSSNSEL